MRYPTLLPAMCVVAAVMQAQTQELPPVPGRLIDIGGRRLHVMCSGTGTPTIVLEAGASSFAIDWTLVQRKAARKSRVCSYDRAGMGWSDPSPRGPRASTVEDLRKLLAAAGERPPYILVGASRGGLFVRDYQADQPTEVAGLVLVDPSTEDRLFTRIDGQDFLIADLTAEQVRSTVPTRPVAVPRRSPQTGAPFDRLPPDIYRMRLLLDERLIASIPDTVSPTIIATAIENERALLARLRTLRAGSEHPLRDMPMVVLTRGNVRNAGREAAHSAVAALSTNSRHTVVAGAGHEIHLFAPARVVQAVEDVVEAVRGRSSLPPR
ncbi:MAG TPA: alpha/beta hydrolase [Dehalococcoidia bacterium]|nr:alpha/beta hydrolase [Dehalococcoidia bacterium]